MGDFPIVSDIQNAVQTFITSTGSANAYVLTLAVAPAAYVTGQTFRFKANFANTGAATVNVNSLGAKALEKIGSVAALATGDILVDQIITITYDGTAFITTLGTANVAVADLADGTDGELITWDSSGVPAAVAVGTAGQVLTSNGVGAAPTMQASAGAWDLLETQSASASSSIDFTSNIDSTFTKYAIEIVDWIPSVDALIQIRISTDGGSTFKAGASDYAWGNVRSNGATGIVVNTDTADDHISIAGSNNIGSDSAKGANFTIKMSNPASSATNTSFEITGGAPDGTVLQQKPMQGSGKYVAATTAVDAIQFLQSTGTITSGIFKLYGIA
ncbi:MAG: hypothetical protein V3V81_07370 [Candidatus Bathyarchaeia archaeon]